MKTKSFIALIFLIGPAAAKADVLGAWTFNSGTTSAERRAAVNVDPGVANLSALSFNNFDDVGVGATPNSVHDGLGFGGNSGEQVAFIHRANYFDGSGVPPKQNANDFTSFGTAATQGTTAGMGDGNAPISFTITAGADNLQIDSLTIDFLPMAALIVGFQEAGASAGTTVTLNSGNPNDDAFLNSPVTVLAGQTKTFTLNLGSAALNTAHIVNEFVLNGSIKPTPIPDVTVAVSATKPTENVLAQSEPDGTSALGFDGELNLSGLRYAWGQTFTVDGGGWLLDAVSLMKLNGESMDADRQLKFAIFPMANYSSDAFGTFSIPFEGQMTVPVYTEAFLASPAMTADDWVTFNLSSSPEMEPGTYGFAVWFNGTPSTADWDWHWGGTYDGGERLRIRSDTGNTFEAGNLNFVLQGVQKLSGGGTREIGAPIAETLPHGVFGYEHFKLNYGVSGANANAGDDKDRDGIKNLEELAYGLNPMLPDADGFSLEAGNVPNNVAISLRLRDDAPHLRYCVERSADLGPDQWEAFSFSGITPQLESLSHAVDRVTAPVDTSGLDRDFLRLKIEMDDSEINQIITIDNQADFNTYATATFSPGDLILFKRGQIFSGMFAPQGSGSPGQPIRIASYGEGAMPIINALGSNTAAIFLQNVEYWEVHNIEVTNTDGSDDHQGKIMGIYVLTNGSRPDAVMDHIYIKGCYIHDVNGTTLDSDPDEAKRHGGIHVHTYGTNDTRINDLQIVGNTIENTGGVGIGTDSDFNDVDGGVTSQLWTNVYIANNFIDDTDRNNMIIRDCIDAVAEYNIMANSSRENTGHSIFSFHSIGFTMQFNEVYGNTGNEAEDRGAFDADYNNRDTVIQYNYSHDNQWFVGIMRRWNKGADIRYNISQDDQEAFCFFGFNNDTGAEDIRVYNNIYHIGPSVSGAQFVADNREPLNTKFYNNIFFFEGGGFYGTGMNSMTGTTFSHNAYSGIPTQSSDTNGVTANPMLVAPGTGGLNIDMTDPNRLPGYRLQNGSPCIDAGKASGTGYVFGDRDFWGEPVPAGSGIDIGASEYQ